MAKSTYPVFNHDPRIVEKGQTQAEQALILEAARLRERVKEQDAALPPTYSHFHGATPVERKLEQLERRVEALEKK